MTLEALPASRFDDATLADLVTRGYEGYFVPIRLDAAAFRAQAESQDIALDASRVLVRDREPVALALLGVRGRAGWIGGMGVTAAARGTGLGRRVMDEVIAAARARGLARVDLEVLDQNTWASRIYEAMGFRDTRRLEVLERPAGPVPSEPVRPAVEPLEVDECLDHHDALHHFERLPWQRDLAVQRRLKSMLVALGVRDARGPVCATLVRPNPGRTVLLDVGLSTRAPAGALAATLAETIRRHGESPMVLLNCEAGHPAAAVLARAGFATAHVQREMSLSLTAPDRTQKRTPGAEPR